MKGGDRSCQKKYFTAQHKYGKILIIDLKDQSILLQMDVLHAFVGLAHCFPG